MQIDRIKRVNEIIRRELATSLIHVGQGEGAEVMRISFVDVEVSRDLRGATVLVSIMGTREQSDELMRWLRRHRVDFQSRIAREVSLKYTPKLFFKQTSAIEKGDRVLDILKEIVLPEETGEHGIDGAADENSMDASEGANDGQV